ncbi:fatty acid desaturase [Novosphingobium colocasiae]|uniref:fatty acid desaturase n=1 Tax=Novosphingobium colocasiae TaxID=1256513 RepID=UPI0035AE336C
MVMTRNPTAREVLNQIVLDPRYAEVMRVPTFSFPQISLAVISLGTFALATIGAIQGVIPVWAAMLLNLVAVYIAFTPLHDASHRAVSSNGFINDTIGVLCGQLLLPCINMTAFRTIHMDHHRFVGQEGRDPDTALVAPPKWAGLAFLMFADLNWVAWFFKYGRHLWSRKSAISIYLLLFMVVAVHVAFLASPYWKEFLFLYVIPQRVGLGIIAYTFAHIQHPEGLTWDNEPFQSTLYVRGDSIFRRLMFGQEEHIIHHLLPHVPWFKYKRVWNLANGTLRKQGIPDRGWWEGPGEIAVPTGEERKPIPMKLAMVRDDANGVRAFRFETTDGRKLAEADAGAHIDIHLPGNLVRQYSVVDSGPDHYTVAVRLDPNGRGGSRAMHALQEGEVLLVGKPRNNFVLYESAPRFVLIAGGIGITPLLPMARRLSDLGKPFVLHACARDAQSAPLATIMDQAPFASQVKYHHDLADGRSGFDADAWLSKPIAGTMLYICGPQGFMDFVRASALARGWDARQIRTESFGAAIENDGEVLPFTVHLQRSGKDIPVSAQESILDALGRFGMDVPYACMQGTCGTCIVGVTGGEVDHRDAFLTAEDKARNDCMCLCVSRAKGESVTLDL